MNWFSVWLISRCLLLLRKELREQVCDAVHLLFELFAVVPELLIVVLEGLQLAVCLRSVVRRRRRKNFRGKVLWRGKDLMTLLNY